MGNGTISDIRTESPATAAAGDKLAGARGTTEVGLLVEDVAAVNKEKYLGQNLQTGAAYTLVLSDAGKIIEMNNAGANTLTIPANASVAFPVNTRIDIIQYGAGLTTVAIDTDTLRGDAVSQGQYKGMSLWKRAATEWVIFGGTT